MSRRRPTIAAIAIALLAGAGACSDSTAAPPPDPPATSSVSTSPPPSPEEEAAAAALVVFEEWVRVGEESSGAPSARDWEPEIRRYSTGQAADASIESVDLFIELGYKQLGVARVEPEVTGVDLAAESGPIVSITACYDSTNSELVFVDTGKSIVPPGAPPELDRLVWLVTVAEMEQQPGSPWMVTTIDPQVDVPC